MPHDVHIDFETYCDLDLRKVGLYRYVEHSSFRVLCMAMKVDTRPTQRVVQGDIPPAWADMLRDHRNVQVHAFNAAFETAVLAHFGIYLARSISCTMQRALAYGLPGRLDQAAAALGLANQKDMTAHRLMLKMTRPLKPGAAPWTPADYAALARYCAGDVEAEAELAANLPELSSSEKYLSELDADMNSMGKLGIDFDRVVSLQAVAEAAEKIDAARCAVLTNGAVTSPGTQTARLLAWLHTQGLNLLDTTRASIEEAILTGQSVALGTCALPPDVMEVLAIRLRMARASTRKLARMLDMSDPASRAIRGQFQFVGAGRTGRWSGRGVQVQNLPRVPKGFMPDDFTRMAHTATISDGGPNEVDAVASAPVLDCVSWSLRSCLKATDDTMLLWSFDFSQIEARVLAWLAGQNDILAVFAAGDDVYLWAAAQFGSKDRQLGKVLVLALGFGMGATKLRETALKAYGVVLTMAQAEAFKTRWRASNDNIVSFWRGIEYAAQSAILRRGQTVPVGGSGIAFCCTAKTLQMRLPSGRVLYYHRPSLDRETGSIKYWGAEVGGRWVEQRTWGGKLAENATQAVARDIMAEAMLRAFDRKQQIPCMTVHDELVYPVLNQRVNYEALMLEAPPWAGGLPLAGESKTMRRYGVNLSSGPVAKSP